MLSGFRFRYMLRWDTGKPDLFFGKVSKEKPE